MPRVRQHRDQPDVEHDDQHRAEDERHADVHPETERRQVADLGDVGGIGVRDGHEHGEHRQQVGAVEQETRAQHGRRHEDAQPGDQDEHDAGQEELHHVRHDVTLHDDEERLLRMFAELRAAHWVALILAQTHHEAVLEREERVAVHLVGWRSPVQVNVGRGHAHVGEVQTAHLNVERMVMVLERAADLH